MVEEQTRQQQQPGTKVWAKLKGYPWWPGQVAEEATIPKTATPSRRVPSAVPILFYGSNDYAWLQPADIKPFGEGNVPDTPKKQTGKLLEAIRLAKEDTVPTGRLPPSTQNDGYEEEDDVSGDDIEEVELEGEKNKPRSSTSKRPRVMATPKAPKAPQTRKTPKTPTASSFGTKATKRKAPPTTGSSKRKKSQQSEDVDMMDAGQDAAATSEMLRKGIKEPKKHRSPFEHLMYLRHRIQKMMKEDPDSFGSSERMEASMREIENFTMTIDLLKETKVGKLMKKVTTMDIDPDPNNVKERAGVLICKWKNEFHMDKDPEQGRDSGVLREHATDHPESDDKPSSTGEREEDGRSNGSRENFDDGSEVNGNDNDAADCEKNAVTPEVKVAYAVETGGAATETSEAVGGMAGASLLQELGEAELREGFSGKRFEDESEDPTFSTNDE